MAGIQYLGQVGSTGTSTGPHKHVYVKDLATGEYLNPATIRTPLMGLRIGEKRIPAIVKDQSGKLVLNPEAGITLTSGFGARSAPTAGASTFHRGEDWALPEGTPIYYEGTGKYKPLANQGGYGNLATFTTGDNKYEIGLAHMKSLGAESEIAGSPAVKADTDTTNNEEDLISLLSLLGYTKPKTFQESLQESVLRQALSPPEDMASMFLRNYIASPIPGME